MEFVNVVVQSITFVVSICVSADFNAENACILLKQLHVCTVDYIVIWYCVFV